jgi:nicotinamide mononucleotide transporter
MTIDKVLEYIAVVSGVVSVWFSRKENILVYPVGLLNTIIYIYLSLKGHLFGEASVNIYYTVVSFYGWYLWTRKDRQNQATLHITYSTSKEKLNQFLFFGAFYVALFISISILKIYFSGAIPWADAFAAATAYTGMWLMAKKKVESWYWWIITDIASIPLYYVKGYEVTMYYYLVLLVMAFFGLAEWKRKANEQKSAP